ncbi:crossover junction endodeoxyribonuclease RuvC [Panacagrimonas sp.]|uniref:crossover junction endodeoxyribonuclease RuvC n=1 Tax=Panacagrimonas sp. TaxID=2480088 RepID=UPI003B526FE2
MRILGVDPGSRYTGYGVIECVQGRSRLIVAGRLDVRAGEMSQRLLAVFEGLADLIREFRPDQAAVEETFVNRVNAASALVLGQARGAAVCACAQAGLPVAEYAAAQVKLAIVGNGRADKDQVAHMVRVLLNTREALAADAADALAVALTHAHVGSTVRRTGDALKRAWG